MGQPTFQFLDVQPTDQSSIYHIQFNRPDAYNFMNQAFWQEFPQLLDWLESEARPRVVILSGKGGHFSGGLDIKDFIQQYSSLVLNANADGRAQLSHVIQNMQRGFQRVARSPIVFIAAIQGYCLGAGLDLATMCDIRLATADAVFSVRETRIGIVADLGSLQRLPALIGDGRARLWALSSRDYTAESALEAGLLSGVYHQDDEMMEESLKLAGEIARHPTLAVQGTKKYLNDVYLQQLEAQMDTNGAWNAAYLDNTEFQQTVMKLMQKKGG